MWASSNICLRACGAKNAAFISTVGAFGYAFAPLVWEYSITAEVFALNNFICAVLINLTCSVLSAAAMYKHEGNNAAVASTLLRSALVGGLFCGLAMANQHSSLLMVAYVVPCTLISIWTLAPQLLTSVLVRSATGFFIGFATYLYLPWAAGEPTRGSWGQLATLSGFMRHILRAEYGTFRLGMIIGSETWYQRIAIYLQHTSEESGHCIFPILLKGLIIYTILRSDGVVPQKRAGTIAVTSVKDAKKGNHSSISKSNKLGQSTKEVASISVQGALGIIVNETGDSSAAMMLIGNLVGMWLFYVLVWHCVLSNLPLSAPMPFAVHSRFWMQPNLVLYILLGVSLGYSADFIVKSMASKETGKATATSTSTSQFLPNAVSGVVVVLYLTLTVSQRYTAMDKSRSGYVLHSYAAALMASIMPNSDVTLRESSAPTTEKCHSLLLSHTDLDWNPVRYLQHCEGVGLESSAFYKKSSLAKLLQYSSKQPAESDLVTHLSFQLMPYPWFTDTQARLYPHVTFPSTHFQGVTTDRASEGNAQLILRFLRANLAHNATYTAVPRATRKHAEHADQSQGLPILRSMHTHFTGGVYLDMQAVHEAEIDAMGQWRGLFLVPWGTVYRVFGPLQAEQIMKLHHYSQHHLSALQRTFPAVDDVFALKFAPGSWERAAANVFYDAHYQFGLNLLTFAIELQTNISMKLMPILMDRYYQSASVLLDTRNAVHKYGTFSSSVQDLSKNTALAWMRLAALLDIVHKFHKEITAEFETLKANVSIYMWDLLFIVF